MLDGNKALGAMLLDFGGPRPQIEGTFALQKLNLTHYIQTSAAQSATPAPNARPDKQKSAGVDFPLLHHLDLDVRISTTELTAPPFTLGQSALSQSEWRRRQLGGGYAHIKIKVMQQGKVHAGGFLLVWPGVWSWRCGLRGAGLDIVRQVQLLECECPFYLRTRSAEIKQHRAERLVAVKHKGRLVKPEPVPLPMERAGGRKIATSLIIQHQNAGPSGEAGQIGDLEIQIALISSRSATTVPTPEGTRWTCTRMTPWSPEGPERT